MLWWLFVIGFIAKVSLYWLNRSIAERRQHTRDRMQLWMERERALDADVVDPDDEWGNESPGANDSKGESTVGEPHPFAVSGHHQGDIVPDVADDDPWRPPSVTVAMHSPPNRPRRSTDI